MGVTMSRRFTNSFEWFGEITLADIWNAVYNPPSPTGLAIVVILLAWRAGHIWHRFTEWRLSRKVVSFSWSEPKVCGYP